MIELRSAYESALTETLQLASQASKSTSTVQTVDIAVAFEEFLDDSPRSRQFPSLQGFMRQFYSLLCIICTERSIDIEDGNDVICRVSIFKALESHEEVILNIDHIHPEALCFNLHMLASCQRPWQHLLSVNDEAGTSLIHDFLSFRKRYGFNPEALNVNRVQAGTTYKISARRQAEVSAILSGINKRHYSVAVGGTFDHLHAGHKLLLAMTGLALEPIIMREANKRRTLTIGITGDALLKNKKFVEELQDWDERQKGVAEFVVSVLMLDSSAEALKSSRRVKDTVSGARSVQDEYKSGLQINYVEIFDPFGPTITDKYISALVVSAETRSGGKAVNDSRVEKEWPPLEVFEVGVLSASNEGTDSTNETENEFNEKISSTAIRERICLHRRERRAK
ncbi:MAG: hypothetical protein Q9191_005236 [Dirinaria sp. TL-2023a]